MGISLKNGNGKIAKIVLTILTPGVVAALIVLSFRTFPWTANAAGLASLADLDTLRSEITVRLDTVDERQLLMQRILVHDLIEKSTLSDDEKKSLKRKIEFRIITPDSAAIFLLSR